MSFIISFLCDLRLCCHAGCERSALNLWITCGLTILRPSLYFCRCLYVSSESFSFNCLLPLRCFGGLFLRLCALMLHRVWLHGRECHITTVAVSFTFIARNKINCAVKYSLGVCSMTQAMIKTVNDADTHLRQVFICCFTREILNSRICGICLGSTAKENNRYVFIWVIIAKSWQIWYL